MKYRNHSHIAAADAIAFLYILGKAEAEGQNGKL